MADSSLMNDGKRIKKATYIERPIHKLTLLLENRVTGEKDSQ